MLKMCSFAGLCLAGTAFAALAGPVAQTTAYPSPEIGDGVIRDAGLVYQTGAYFYGSDCGGNSAMTPANSRRVVSPGGVILGGVEGHTMVSALNCDDRRQALSIYRDAFEGRVGQTHDWRNENGGGKGSVTLVRSYSANGVKCSDVRAAANSQQALPSHDMTACRQKDGNWHTQ